MGLKAADIRQWADNNVPTWLVVLILIAVPVGAVGKWLDAVGDLALRLIRSITDVTTNQITLTSAGEFIVGGMVALIPIAFYAGHRVLTRIKAAQPTQVAPKGSVLGPAAELYRTIKGDKAKVRVSALVATYRVTADFGVETEQVWKLRASEGPVFAREFWRQSDDAPLDSHEALDIVVRDEVRGTTLPYVVAKDAPTRKEFVMFFIPPLDQAEDRTIRVKTVWPGAMAPLQHKREDDIAFNVPGFVDEDGVDELVLCVTSDLDTLLVRESNRQTWLPTPFEITRPRVTADKRFWLQLRYAPKT